MQGLRILAFIKKPKFTVSTVVILEVLDNPISRVKVDIQLVVNSLARIFNIYAKVRDVIIIIIATVFNDVRSFDWTSKGCPIRRSFCLFSTDICYVTRIKQHCKIVPIDLLIVFFINLYNLFLLVSKRDS